MKMGIELKEETLHEKDVRVLCLVINNTHEILFSGLSNGNITIWSLSEKK